MINKITEFIKQNDGFTIISHVSPDGDTLGSSLALYLALGSMGKRASLRCHNEVPVSYSFLPYSGDYGEGEVYKNVIAIDCADKGRLSSFAGLFDSAEHAINIDHHETNPEYGEYNLVVPNAAATGEIIFELVASLGVSLNKDIATCLYTAISTDTGNFTYSNTTKNCFKTCAELAALVDIATVTRMLYRTRSYSKTLLIKLFIERIQLHAEGKVAVAVISQQDLKSIGSNSSETENIIDYARDIESVEIAALILEVKEGEYKISLRSKQYADVSAIAVRYNGGGHQFAAGCRIRAAQQQAYELLVTEMTAEIQ